MCVRHKLFYSCCCLFTFFIHHRHAVIYIWNSARLSTKPFVRVRLFSLAYCYGRCNGHVLLLTVTIKTAPLRLLIVSNRYCCHFFIYLFAYFYLYTDTRLKAAPLVSNFSFAFRIFFFSFSIFICLRALRNLHTSVRSMLLSLQLNEILVCNVITADHCRNNLLYQS